MAPVILAFDPGGTTGWAGLRSNIVVGQNAFEAAEWFHGQLGPDEHHYDLYALLMKYYGTGELLDVVTESFEYRGQDRPGIVLASKEYIGVIKMFSQEVSMTDHYFEQTASVGKVVTGKGFVKPDNLKKLGLWSPGNKHAMDAYGHLIQHILKHYRTGNLSQELLRRGWK